MDNKSNFFLLILLWQKNYNFTSTSELSSQAETTTTSPSLYATSDALKVEIHLAIKCNFPSFKKETWTGLYLGQILLENEWAPKMRSAQIGKIRKQLRKTKVKLMTPVVHKDIPTKEILSQKRFSSCWFVYISISLHLN